MEYYGKVTCWPKNKSLEANAEWASIDGQSQFTECEGQDLRAFVPYTGFLTSEEEHGIIKSEVRKHLFLV